MRRRTVLLSALGLGSAAGGSVLARGKHSLPARDAGAAESFRTAQDAPLAGARLDAPTRFVEVRAPRLRVQVIVAGAGVPVVFVHGGNSMGKLDAAPRAHADRFRLHAPDRPGCGLTGATTISASVDRRSFLGSGDIVQRTRDGCSVILPHAGRPNTLGAGRISAMVAKKAARTGARHSARKASKNFTEEERAAMKERAQELKAAARRGAGTADGEKDLLEKIARMPQRDRAMAERLHALIKAAAPDLVPRTWYGMPAYAREGKVVCFFQSGQKFKTRYATLGFSDKANLDEGAMWPTSFALTGLTDAEAARIAALVKKALS